jgi:hypothetical protein
MRPFADRALLEQTTFDSATPSGTALVMHRFAQPGRYALALSPDGETVVETRTIFVGDEEPDGTAERSGRRASELRPPRPAATGSPLPQAIAVDLRPIPHHVSAAAPPVPGTVSEGGYASFTAPAGQAHRVVVSRVGSAGLEGTEFDSARLAESDVFAVTILRPGTYRIANRIGGHEGKLVVTYPVVGRAPYRPPEPVTIHSREGHFEPDSVTIGPGQGVIFQVVAESHIVVELVEPDDGPGDAPGRRPPLARRRLRPAARPGAEQRDSPPDRGDPGRGAKA